MPVSNTSAGRSSSTCEVVVVTGAASGIGLETARLLQARGTEVIGVDLSWSEVPPGLLTVTGDVADPETWRGAARMIREMRATVGSLVLAAACLDVGTILTLDESKWRRMIEVNLFGVIRPIATFLPGMIERGGGSIVIVGSIDSYSAEQGLIGYCASKGAVLQVSRTLALDHARDNIRVNCVCPGVTDTPFFRRHLATATDPEAFLRRRENAILLGDCCSLPRLQRRSSSSPAQPPLALPEHRSSLMLGSPPVSTFAREREAIDVSNRFSLKALHYASQTVPGAQVFFQHRFESWLDFHYYAFLARRGEEIVLFDVGMDAPGAFGDSLVAELGVRGSVRMRKPFTELLREEGVDPSKVSTIFVSHFHADHVSNLRIFEHAKIYVSAPAWRQLEAARSTYPDMIPDPLYPADILHFVRKSINARVFLLEDGDTPVDGIRIRHLGGHSPDMTGYEVESTVGSVALPMDTVWTYENLVRNHPPGAASDILECFAAMEWVRNGGALMIPGHDPLLLERHPFGVIAP